MKVSTASIDQFNAVRIAGLEWEPPLAELSGVIIVESDQNGPVTVFGVTACG
jgi:hypothetical protein